jgi:hypothetical protein
MMARYSRQGNIAVLKHDHKYANNKSSALSFKHGFIDGWHNNKSQNNGTAPYRQGHRLGFKAGRKQRLINILQKGIS